MDIQVNSNQIASSSSSTWHFSRHYLVLLDLQLVTLCYYTTESKQAVTLCYTPRVVTLCYTQEMMALLDLQAVTCYDAPKEFMAIQINYYSNQITFSSSSKLKPFGPGACV